MPKFRVSIVTAMEIEADNREQAKKEFFGQFPADTITTNPHLILMDRSMEIEELDAETDYLY